MVERVFSQVTSYGHAFSDENRQLVSRSVTDIQLLKSSVGARANCNRRVDAMWAAVAMPCACSSLLSYAHVIKVTSIVVFRPSDGVIVVGLNLNLDCTQFLTC